MTNYKKTLQEILDWVESLTGVSAGIGEAGKIFLCQSSGFNGKKAGTKDVTRIMRSRLGSHSPEMTITFQNGTEEALADSVSNFIETLFSQSVQKDRSIEALSREIIANYGEINFFYKLSEALVDISDFKNACRKILEQVLERIPCEKTSILLWDQAKRCFVLAAGIGCDLEKKVQEEKLYDLESSLLKRVVETKEPLMINNMDELLNDAIDSCGDLLGKKSVLAVRMPLLNAMNSNEMILGLIILSDKKSDNSAFTSPDLKLLMALAFQASVAIAHWKSLEKEQISKKTLEDTYGQLMYAFETQLKHAVLNEQMNMISKRISATQNIRSIFDALADYARNLLRTDFSIAAFKKKNGNVHLRSSPGFKEKDRMEELSKNLKPGSFLNILETGEIVSYQRKKDTPIELGLDFKKTFVRNFLGIPVACHKKPMGVIAVFNSEGPEGFTDEDVGLLTSLAHQASTVLENAELVNRLSEAQYTTMIKLAELAEKRDPETGLHLERMKHYCKILALETGKQEKYSAIITEDFVESLFQSSPLHDIGKVGIYDEVLLKPGKLTIEEFEVMKTHTSIGAEILQGPDFLKTGRNLALCHHEKFDGTGYPNGFKGDEIPIEARILSLADVYDALTSKRVYKDAFPFEKTYSIIMEGNGTAFDPDVVEAFNNSIDKFKEIQEKYED